MTTDRPHTLSAPFLGLRDGKLRAQHSGEEFGSEGTLLETWEDFAAFVRREAEIEGVEPHEIMFLCSSSLDFPEDETDDPRVIALCRRIRS